MYNLDPDVQLPNNVSNKPRSLDCTDNTVFHFVKRVVKWKIDFLVSASKLEVLFNTNISLAPLRRLRPNTLRYTSLHATRSLENVA